jgi:hypothetical protein
MKPCPVFLANISFCHTQVIFARHRRGFFARLQRFLAGKAVFFLFYAIFPAQDKHPKLHSKPHISFTSAN